MSEQTTTRNVKIRLTGEDAGASQVLDRVAAKAETARRRIDAADRVAGPAVRQRFSPEEQRSRNLNALDRRDELNVRRAGRAELVSRAASGREAAMAEIQSRAAEKREAMQARRAADDAAWSNWRSQRAAELRAGRAGGQAGMMEEMRRLGAYGDPGAGYGGGMTDGAMSRFGGAGGGATGRGFRFMNNKAEAAESRFMRDSAKGLGLGRFAGPAGAAAAATALLGFASSVNQRRRELDDALQDMIGGTRRATLSLGDKGMAATTGMGQRVAQTFDQGFLGDLVDLYGDITGKRKSIYAEAAAKQKQKFRADMEESKRKLNSPYENEARDRAGDMGTRARLMGLRGPQAEVARMDEERIRKRAKMSEEFGYAESNQLPAGLSSPTDEMKKLQELRAKSPDLYNKLKAGRLDEAKLQEQEDHKRGRELYEPMEQRAKQHQDRMKDLEAEGARSRMELAGEARAAELRGVTDEAEAEKRAIKTKLDEELKLHSVGSDAYKQLVDEARDDQEAADKKAKQERDRINQRNRLEDEGAQRRHRADVIGVQEDLAIRTMRMGNKQYEADKAEIATRQRGQLQTLADEIAAEQDPAKKAMLQKMAAEKAAGINAQASMSLAELEKARERQFNPMQYFGIQGESRMLTGNVPGGANPMLAPSQETAKNTKEAAKTLTDLNTAITNLTAQLVGNQPAMAPAVP